MARIVSHPLPTADASIVAGLRQAMAMEKGRYRGPAARQPFEAMKNGVEPAACETVEGSVGGVPGWRCHPPEARRDAALIYYHDGWYMLGTAAGVRVRRGPPCGMTGLRPTLWAYG